MKKPSYREINVIRNSLLAGFCLVSGVILVSFGGPWPLWAALFIFAIIFSLRS